MTLYLRVGARSDVGLVREGNEDSLFAGHRLLAVADGVGGAAFGEVASATTIDTLRPLDDESTDALEDPLAALHDAIIAANDRLRELIERDPQLNGMGTTLTALLWSRQRLALAQVGDSRAYRLRAGQLEQVSHDQTFVQTLVDEGRITADQAINHPQRNIILNAMDGREGVEPVLDLLDPEPGDRYLVCSDGLSDYVLASDVTVAAGEGDPQQACERLVELALEAGAPDNVSCIVAEVLESSPPPDDRLPIIAGAVALPAYQSPADDHPTTELRAGGPATAVPAPPSPARRDGQHAQQSSRSGIGRRLGIVIGVVVVLVAAAVIGTLVYTRHQYYVAAAGTTPTRAVAIYQGVHGHALGFGSHITATTNLPVTALPQDERQQVDGGGIDASGAAGAQQVVANLRQNACALATAQPAPSSPTATPPVKATPSAKPTVTPTPTAPVWCTP
ncbi:MAG TPA: protein phosphatase 2C domain-containing protein [Mycobacteriales bacterium]|nr:protein phosphatase 2C domain-containing protein [Mycobacteriales bacterium]